MMSTSNGGAGKTPVTPKDAAAMILLRDPQDPKVFWVKRAKTLSFMASYHAFPGGQRDAGDVETPILNEQGLDEVVMRVTAIREVFEETGVLIARGSEGLSPQRRAEMRHELETGQTSFRELLAHEGLSLDASLLTETPRWVTPASLPRRYDTRFYSAWLPEGQEPDIIPGELESGEWLRAEEALHRFTDGDCLIVTPITSVLRALTGGAGDLAERMNLVPQSERDHLEHRVEFRYGFYLTALRTPTIPPATHTNCYLVGGDELVVIDPGSPYREEQAILDEVLDRFLAEGKRVREILITHLHPDHIGGVRHLAERYGLPVATHRLTAEEIAGDVRVDRLIEDGEIIELQEASTGVEWKLRALWTPGHARGHLSFYEERTGTLLTGDCVVGFGTVVIAPPEGNMLDYLASLRRYLGLPRLTALMPGHGPVLANPREKIEEYIAHRLAREGKILNALEPGARTIPEIVATVYVDTPAALHQLAELSVFAHLEKLEAESMVSRRSDQWSLTRATQ